MTEQRKESIKECIKMMCDTKVVDVNYNDITVDFRLMSVLRGNIKDIAEYVMVANKNKEICYFTSGDVDIEVICKDALLGYVRETKRCLSNEENKKREEEYRNKHPILGFFKY